MLGYIRRDFKRLIYFFCFSLCVTFLTGSKVRIATLQMTILLLKQLAVKGSESYLLDRHLAAIEQCREESTLMLRNFYKVS